MELLAPLPFLKRPLDRSLEVSVFKPFQALNKHAMAFILPYLVNSYFDQCQGNEDYLYVRNFAIRLSPHIFVRIESNKFGQTDILDRFKSAIASWFEQYCSLHTAVYSLKDAFNPLFENLEFKMQLNFARNLKVELYEVQLKAEKSLSEHLWRERCKLLKKPWVVPPPVLTNAKHVKLFEDRML